MAAVGNAVEANDATPVLLHTGSTGNTVFIHPHGNGAVFIGPSNVTAATGFPVHEIVQFASITGTDIYGITSSGIVDVRVFVQPSA